MGFLKKVQLQKRVIGGKSIGMNELRIKKNEIYIGLSVLLVTYNHEKYIRKALSTIFSQIIEGPIELVIADDGSSDDTLNIIKEHEGKDPRFHFKYLDSTSNIGITKNYQRGFAACTGKFVAVLEGDDYWANSGKLQNQLNFLNSHCGCDLCSVNYFVYEEALSRFTPRTTIGKGYRFIGARDLIADNLIGNFSTCMYRKSALDQLPQSLFEIKSYDWIVNICVASKGLIGFLEEPMSVYRLHANGVWTQKSCIEKFKEQLKLIPAYDELTKNVFKDDFENLARCLQRVIDISKIDCAVGNATKPFGTFLPTILDIIPPIFLSFVRALLPPKLKSFILRKLRGTA
jgi:glycosyltransferase involved in cell wall biosynthesis